jgi:hypothetical protein
MMLSKQLFFIDMRTQFIFENVYTHKTHNTFKKIQNEIFIKIFRKIIYEKGPAS